MAKAAPARPQTMKAKKVLKTNGKVGAGLALVKRPGSLPAKFARVGAPTSAASKGPLPTSKWPPGAATSKNGRTPGRPFWLPEDWACGVKTTCHTFLPVFISPERKMYYHKEAIEKALGYQLGPEATKEGAVRWALERLQRLEDWTGQKVATPDDSRLLAVLSKEERAHLPPVAAFHVGVVSARRAGDASSIKDVISVEVLLRASGVKPKWYVDADSLGDYRALGLDAIVGGKLTPARNMALNDAAKAKKLCVQVSDDISKWEYWNVAKVVSKVSDFKVQNKLAASSRKAGNCLNISPAAAMRFMAAKMRAVGAKLGGVYPQANIARAFSQPITTAENFILGDFFVADKSPVRFDESMSLKEDYDYTCGHLAEHGQVLRFNRMVLIVKHNTNAGGAVSVRDTLREQQNIAVLQQKWPGVFRLNPTRKNEVILNWNRRGELDAKRPLRGGRGPKVAGEGLPAEAVVSITEKIGRTKGFLAERCRMLHGRKVSDCLGEVTYKDGKGKIRRYLTTDMKYDIALGRITLAGGGGEAVSEQFVSKHWAVKGTGTPTKAKAKTPATCDVTPAKTKAKTPATGTPTPAKATRTLHKAKPLKPKAASKS